METIDLDKIYEKSNLKWLKSNTIYVTLAGSYSYGTNTENSDIDIRSVCTVPKESNRIKINDLLINTTEQYLEKNKC